MKLTPRSQGYRFRKKDWGKERFVDLLRVEAPDALGRRLCEGTDEGGRRTAFLTLESDSGWVRLGSIEKFKP